MENILKQRNVFQGRVVSVDEVDIDFDNGNNATFELIGFNVVTAVSALAIDDQDNAILIKHFQLGAKKRLITLPTGGLEKNEQPEARMQQELQEEIGYKAGKLSLMFRSHAFPGYIGTEPTHIFLAQNLTPSKLQGDEIEDLEIIKIPFPKLITMIKKNQTTDARLISAALYYQQFYRQ